VLEWCVGNVVGKPDRRGNLYPAKQRPEQKIDAAVALMMAVGRAMAEDTNEGDLTNFPAQSSHRLMGCLARPAGGHGG
jgi:phage terminase large subunit-like protein